MNRDSKSKIKDKKSKIRTAPSAGSVGRAFLNFLPPALLTRAERVKGLRQNKIKNQNVKIKIVDSPLG